jgi:hypothetical protein
MLSHIYSTSEVAESLTVNGTNAHATSYPGSRQHITVPITFGHSRSTSPSVTRSWYVSVFHLYPPALQAHAHRPFLSHAYAAFHVRILRCLGLSTSVSGPFIRTDNAISCAVTRDAFSGRFGFGTAAARGADVVRLQLLPLRPYPGL